jgi:hypothetical protein
MTQSEAGERKRTQVSVRSAESTSGRYGPQWTLTVSYPWSKGKTSRAWIARDEFLAEIKPGMYQCLVEKGEKWADDTDEDWGYNWKIVEFGSAGDAPPPPNPVEEKPTVSRTPIAPLPDEDISVIKKRVSIERQTSLNRAVDLVLGLIEKGTSWDDVVNMLPLPIPEKTLADNFYHWLSNPPETSPDTRTEEERDFEALGAARDGDERHPAER